MPTSEQNQHSTNAHSSLDKANTGEKYTLQDQNSEISLMELFLKVRELHQYLLGRWKVILVAGFIGGLLGLVYAIVKKPLYTATTTFVLEEGDNGGGLAQYAGIASMVGIDLGGGGGGVFQGDNILELYRSRRMIQQALLSRDTFDGKQQLLVDRYIEFNKLKKVLEKSDKVKNIEFSIPLQDFTLQHDSLMKGFVQAINEDYLSVTKPDKKLSIIQVNVKSEDELFAKAFAENIVATVNDFYVQTRTKKSAENLAILQHQADSVRIVLNRSIGGVAAAIDANPNSNPAFQRLAVPSQRRQVDVEASGAVYQEIVKNLEMAKISLRNDKPLIQIIDEPILPLNEEKIGKVRSLLLAGITGCVMCIFFLLFSRLIDYIKSL